MSYREGPVASETVSHKAIRGKRFPRTRKSKHDQSTPGAHLECAQTSKKAGMAGVRGKGTWEKWGQRGIRLNTGHWNALAVTLRSKVFRVL